MGVTETRTLSIAADGTAGAAFLLVDHHAYRMEALSPETRVPLAYAIGGQGRARNDWQVVDAFDLRAWEWANSKEDAIRKLRRVAGKHRTTR